MGFNIEQAFGGISSFKRTPEFNETFGDEAVVTLMTGKQFDEVHSRGDRVFPSVPKEDAKGTGQGTKTFLARRDT